MSDKGYRETEEDFMKTIIDLLHLKGWIVAHFRHAMRKDGSWITPVQADGKGFPDLVAVRDKPNRYGSTVLFREIKTDTGKHTSAQEIWRDLLLHAKADYGTWYPRDWDKILVEVE